MKVDCNTLSVMEKYRVVLSVRDLHRGLKSITEGQQYSKTVTQQYSSTAVYQYRIIQQFSSSAVQ